MLVIFRGTLRAQLEHSMGTFPVPVGAQLRHNWGKKHSMGTVWQGSVEAKYGHSWGTVGARTSKFLKKIRFQSFRLRKFRV